MKDFDKWNKLKKNIHNNPKIKFFHTREIWWCSLGLNVGYEQDGKNKYFERPVLVFKKLNNYVLWILPLTKSDKKGKYYCRFEYGNIKYSVILSQIRLVCSRRLLRRIRILPKDEYRIVKNRFKKLV